jgi:hypothetical protein
MATTLKLYAETPARRTAQVVADLVFVLWVVLWVWVGHAIHDGTLGWPSPGGRPRRPPPACRAG